MSSKYLKNEITRIKNIIIQSVHSKQYFLYKSKNKLLSKSYLEDDWNYCLIILRFINSKEDIKTISEIVESFLRSDRYRTKFDQYYNYLNTTIAKAILNSSKSGLLGFLYSQYTNQINQCNLKNSSDNCITYSCKVENILKISNFLCIFYLDKPLYSDFLFNYEFNYTLNSTSFIKISMLSSLLNDFDLMLFLNILYSYKSVIKFSSNNGICINFSTINCI